MTPRYSAGFVSLLTELMGYGLSRVQVDCIGYHAQLALYFGRNDTSYITIKGKIYKVSQVHTAATFTVKNGIIANATSSGTKMPEAFTLIMKSRRILQAYFIGVPSVTSGFNKSYYTTKKDLNTLVAK